MAVDYRFALDKSPKKYRCPQCGKKTFVLFRDQDGSYAPDIFGRCDREQKCGYFARPSDERVIVEPRLREVTPPSYVPLTDIKPTFTGVHLSNLFIFLASRWGAQDTSAMFAEYLVGADQTSPNTIHWSVFWQTDIHGHVRSAKLIRYNPNGRRDHAHNATWWHRVHQHRFTDFNLVQCFFGEHLLKLSPTKKVAVVESEKTAIIASYYMPEYVWIACGGKNGLSRTKCQVLRNRHVTLFPDLGAYKDWKLQASQYGFNVSRTIEDIATDDQREQGLDIADFLMK